MMRTALIEVSELQVNLVQYENLFYKYLVETKGDLNKTYELLENNFKNKIIMGL